MRRGLWHLLGAMAAALAVVVGCRDLALPDENLTSNPGPTLRFVSPVPAAGDEAPVVSLVSFVSVEAQDADGVGSVELSCDAGGAEVALVRWISPPYEASIDLSPCRGASLDGGAELSLLLTARATDALGNLSAQAQSVRVRVNVDIASLVVRVPQRVSPGRPFDITVSSDRTLLGLPQVRVEGVPVVFMGTQTGAGGLPDYLFRAPNAPPLGAESFPGPGAPPVEVLEQVERFVAVVAEARATNGNLTSVQAQIRVARILWDRPLPFAFYVDGVNGAQIPVGAADGVYVPLTLPARAGALDIVLHRGENGEPAFIPQGLLTDQFEPRQAVTTGGLVVVSDGGVDVRLLPDGGLALKPPPRHQATTLPDGAVIDDDGGVAEDDAGVIPLDGGTPVFDGGTPATRVLSLVIDPATGAALHASVALKGKRGALVAAGSVACEEDITSSTCPAPTQRGVNCTGVDGDVFVDGGTETFATGVPAVIARSGDVLGVLNAGFGCVSGLDNPIKLAPLAPGHTGFVTWPGPGIPFNRVLPEGNGRFFGTYFDGAQDRVVEFDLASGSRFSPAGFPTVAGSPINPDQILAGRPDHTLVLFQPGSLTTRFAAWSPATGQLVAQVDLPFVYSYVPTGSPILPASAETDSDGTVYLLLRREGTTVGHPRLDVVALAPSLQPRWIYHYPRNDEAAAGAYRLTLDRKTGQLYLIDGDNGFVVALAR